MKAAGGTLECNVTSSFAIIVSGLKIHKPRPLKTCANIISVINFFNALQDAEIK